MTSHPEFNNKTTSYAVTSAFPSSVKGKVILITGVNADGLGGSSARALATQAPKLLILTGRGTSKAQLVINEIHKEYPDVQCRAVACELSSLESIRKAAEEINSITDRIDIVINNAAVMGKPGKEVTADGLEMQFGVNHLGHFLLTNLLVSKLVSAAQHAPAGAVRVVNVSSYGHNFSPIRFSDLQWEKKNEDLPEAEQADMTVPIMLGMVFEGDTTYNYAAAYGNSKTANILFSIGLNKRLEKHGIASFALHPGSINTELTRNVDPAVIALARERFYENTQAAFKDLEQGASTQLVAALDPALKVEGVNVYLDDCQLKEAKSWARDENAAERLWTVSEELVNQKFAY